MFEMYPNNFNQRLTVAAEASDRNFTMLLQKGGTAAAPATQ